MREGADPLSDDPIAPTLHENLTPELREAFTRTFEEGHDLPERRTTAREWHALLDSYCLRLHDGCPNNPEHDFSTCLARGARRARPNQGNKDKGKNGKKKNEKTIRLGT